MGIHTGTQSNHWGKIDYTLLGSGIAQGCSHGNIQGACMYCAYQYQQYAEPLRSYQEYCRQAQQSQPPIQDPVIVEKEVKGERVDNQVKRLEEK